MEVKSKTEAMKKPKRSDDKYWNGTRNFDHIQYETDLEEYITDLELLASEEKEKEAVKFYNWATKEQVSNPNLILSTSTAELFQLYKSQQND